MTRKLERLSRIAWVVVARRYAIDGRWLRARGVSRMTAYHITNGRTVPSAVVLALLPETIILEWVREMRRAKARTSGIA